MGGGALNVTMYTIPILHDYDRVTIQYVQDSGSVFNVLPLFLWGSVPWGQTGAFGCARARGGAKQCPKTPDGDA